MKREMEGLLPVVRHQFFANFYGKNVSKGKMYTVQHFKKMGCKKITLYHVMGLVDAGESMTQREGQGMLRKLTKAQEKEGDILRSRRERALT